MPDPSTNDPSSPETGDSEAFAELRIDYSFGELLTSTADPDPLAQFRLWLNDAVEAGIREPNAMTLSTVDEENRPWSRIVLLKGLEDGGFYFYTNYESRKGGHLAVNSSAALNFHWKELERQVSIQGTVAKIDAAASEDYFKTRPYESQIGAWVSRQSEVIPDRDWLEQRREELTKQYPPGEVPLPDFWGGYRLEPATVEFWQGRPARLHDRILFERKDDGVSWNVSRLSP